MVIGGIGYCNIQGNFRFHKNLIEGLQIFNGALLYGIFHPKPKNSEHDHTANETANEDIKYHFMLSPIPYSVWPKSARFIIRLKHVSSKTDSPVDGQTQGIQEISKFLHDNNVAVIYSFSNRSAHRYSTWVLHVCFDDVDINSEDFDEGKSYYTPIYEKSKWVTEKIQENFADLLFTDEEDADLIKSIVTRINTSCHYFYYESERLQAVGTSKEKKAYRHFKFRYNNGNFVPVKSGIISEVINILEPSQKNFPLQSICFAESDSHFLNLRIIIIPNRLKHKFFKLSVFHERQSNDITLNNTSKGLLHLVTNSLPPSHKVWKSSTLLFEHRESYCSGKLSLFIEANLQLNEKQAEGHREMLEDRLNALVENMPEDLSHIRLKVRCEKIFPDLIKRYFKIESPEFSRHPKGGIEISRKLVNDVFISYSKTNEEHMLILKKCLKDFGVKVFIDNDRLQGGKELSGHIYDGLTQSRELCFLVSKQSIESIWVTTEWGAAWALDMHITPILIGITFDELKNKLDNRITEKSCIIWPADNKELQKYAKEILSRRFESMLYHDDYDY